MLSRKIREVLSKHVLWIKEYKGLILNIVFFKET